MVAISESPCHICHRIKHLFSHPVLDPVDSAHWGMFAQRLPRATFILWLANETASDLISHNTAHSSIADLIVGVDNEDNASGNHYQHDAERFLQTCYFTLFDHTWRRRIMVFRRLVQHKLKMGEQTRH
jgi:hypothetical protein